MLAHCARSRLGQVSAPDPPNHEPTEHELCTAEAFRCKGLLATVNTHVTSPRGGTRIARRRALEREEFDRMFAECYVRVVRFVERRTGDHAIAEEIAAETFLVAWAKRHRAEISLPWLYRTARNKIGDHFRRSQRKRLAEQALARLAEEPETGISTLERLDLAAAMEALSSRERDVVMLTYWEDLTAREVGEVLGTSESAIWVALTRARKKLRDRLSEATSDAMGGDHAIRR